MEMATHNHHILRKYFHRPEQLQIRSALHQNDINNEEKKIETTTQTRKTQESQEIQESSGKQGEGVESQKTHVRESQKTHVRQTHVRRQELIFSELS